MKVLVIDPIWYWVSTVGSTPSSTSANPALSDQVSAPCCTTAAAIPGARAARWSSRSWREQSSWVAVAGELGLDMRVASGPGNGADSVSLDSVLG